MIALGLIGFPLTYSLSPKLHKAALNYAGLQGSYNLFPVNRDAKRKLEILLNQVRACEVEGLNVTIPYKQVVIPLLDELTPSAQFIGAVNTIFLKNGQLIGDNTDAPGFMADIQRLFPSLSERQKESRHALVLGAGGAARAVVYALIRNGWDVSIASRRMEQSQELVAQFSQFKVNLTVIAFSSAAIGIIHPSPTLVVNTTPVGMSPDIENSPWPGDLTMPNGAAVYDLIYTPHETRLIKEARIEGLQAFNGMGMLVEQAAKSFKIWTGIEVPRNILFAAVEEKWF